MAQSRPVDFNKRLEKQEHLNVSSERSVQYVDVLADARTRSAFHAGASAT